MIIEKLTVKVLNFKLCFFHVQDTDCCFNVPNETILEIPTIRFSLQSDQIIFRADPVFSLKGSHF